MISTALLCVLVVAIALSALFSGSETGFYSFSRLRLRVEAEEGDQRAGRVRRLIRRPALLLAFLLLGNSLALEGVTLAGQLFLEQVGDLSPNARATILASVLTPILFVFAEALPKNVFLVRPYEMLARVSLLLILLYRLLWPVSWLLAEFARLLSRRRTPASGAGPGPGEGPSSGMFGALDLGVEEGLLSRTEHLLAAGVLRFGGLRAIDVARPLDLLPSLPLPADQEVWRQRFEGQQRTRGLVMSANGQDVVGMVHVLDFAAAAAKGQDFEGIVRPIPVLSGDLPVPELLQRLHGEGQQVALVDPGSGRPRRLVRLQDLAQTVLGSRRW